MPAISAPRLSSRKVSAVHAALRGQIATGEWAEGDTLPTETELAARFDCSISTISKAVGLLAHEGLVERRRRAGTRVISSKTTFASSAATANDQASPPLTDLGSVAFIYPAERHEGIWREARGFQDAAHDGGQRVMLLSTSLDFHKEAEFMTRLDEFAVRGALVWPNLFSAEAQAAFVKATTSARYPIVLTSPNPLGLDCPVVTLDGFHAGYTPTRHLVERGARRIGYLSARSRSASMRERYLGYRKAVEEAGITPAPEWVCLDSSMNVDLTNPMEEPEAMAATYLQAASAGAPDGIDAVVCSTDFLAVAVIEVARRTGLRIPHDLRVTGMDDSELAARSSVPLTSYRIPYEEIGATGYRVLHDALAGQLPRSAGPVEHLLRGMLTQRDSS
ncbi:GntR family transcriptional regulator [Opitutaceae bacterium TAV5]|nr:GntR family transcriptional regulator [Opitutaceae bacterium TAV5]